MATTGTDKYAITTSERVVERLSEILTDVDLRLIQAESRYSATDRAVQEVASQAIRYLEGVVVPSATKVSDLLRSLNHLFETTSTSTVTVSTGLVTFVIDPDDREVFATLGYVIADAVGAPTQSGLGGPVVSFDQDTGVVAIDPDYTWGSGQFSSWKLTASPNILAITKAAGPVITDQVTAIGNAISADAVARIAAAQALVQAVADSRLPRDGSQPMTNSLSVQGDVLLVKAYPGLQFQSPGEDTWGWQRIPGGSVRYVNYASGLEVFKITSSGDISAAVMGNVKAYTDKGVRTDVAQQFTGSQKSLAKRNAGIIGTTYVYTADVTLDPLAHKGALIYLQGGSTANLFDVNLYDVGEGILFHAWNGDATIKGYNGQTVGVDEVVNNTFILRKGRSAWVLNCGGYWNVFLHTAAPASTLSANFAQTFTDAQKQQLLANVDIATPHGQCRLNYVSPTQIRLDAFNGNKIWIGNNYRKILSPGPVLNNSDFGGLAANTLYYIYAYWDGTNIKLSPIPQGSIGTPSVSATYGHRIPGNGDGNYTLVGMVYTNASAQFESNDTSWFVASWFNRRPQRIGRNIGNGGSTNAGSYVQLGDFISFVGWADLPVTFYQEGFGFGAAAGAQLRQQLNFDGGMVGPQAIGTCYANGAFVNLSISWLAGVSEGKHSASPYILGNGGGGTFTIDLFMEVWI